MTACCYSTQVFFVIRYVRPLTIVYLYAPSGCDLLCSVIQRKYVTNLVFLLLGNARTPSPTFVSPKEPYSRIGCQARRRPGCAIRHVHLNILLESYKPLAY